MESLKFLLSDQGPLAEAMPDFSVREGQQALAEDIAEAISAKEVFIAEAGTGIGKTFAYLLPALLSRQKILISTGTKHLQDQLFHRDIPWLRKTMALPARIALLKGRGNYLCHYRIQLFTDFPLEAEPEDLARFELIKRYLTLSKTGDVSEVKELSEEDPLLSSVTSTAENCLGQECPFISDCFVMKARKRAASADLLVINHHLYFSDLLIREEGITPLLPEFSTVIFDEAHQLPEIAQQFFGEKLSSRELLQLTEDVLEENRVLGADMSYLIEECRVIVESVQQVRIHLGDENRKAEWQRVYENPKLRQSLRFLKKALMSIADYLNEMNQRIKAASRLHERILMLIARLTLLLESEKNEMIQWFETFKKSFTISLTPLSIAKQFAGMIRDRQCAWIFLSATLTCNGDFSHFQSLLGLENALTGIFPSPFDYQSQALFYVPRGLPDPFSPDFIEILIEKTLPIVLAAKGRTFFLFTSYQALNKAAAILPTLLPFPILVQGSQPKSVLLEQFKLQNAVLLGTSSFWEGVDVKGDALSLVIIDKLPFASPGDPVMAGRLNALKQNGKDPFMNYQLPEAIVTLRQGVGRLIRNDLDCGVIVFGDMRLLTRYYGETIFASLPASPLTRNADKAIAFLEAIA